YAHYLWSRPPRIAPGPADAQSKRSGLRAAHRRHHQLLAPAGAAIDARAIPEREIARHADADFAQPFGVATDRDAAPAEAGIGLGERFLDRVGRDREFRIQLEEFGGNFHDRAGLADRLEVGPRRQARAGAVLVPLMEDQAGRRHQIDDR